MERGIAKETARRLVKSGKLQAHQVVGIHGPEWCVHPAVVSDLAQRTHGGAGDAPGLRNGPATVAPGEGGANGHQPPGLSELVALVDRLSVENRRLAEVAAVWRERARRLEERLALAVPPSPVEAPGNPDPRYLLPDAISPSWVTPRIAEDATRWVDSESNAA